MRFVKVGHKSIAVCTSLKADSIQRLGTQRTVLVYKLGLRHMIEITGRTTIVADESELLANVFPIDSNIQIGTGLQRHAICLNCP